jgi:hypothetical protein
MDGVWDDFMVDWLVDRLDVFWLCRSDVLVWYRYRLMLTMKIVRRCDEMDCPPKIKKWMINNQLRRLCYSNSANANV